MTRVRPWRPDDTCGNPARFGMSDEQWRDLNAIALRYETGHLSEWPDGFNDPREHDARLCFARYLRAVGIINEGPD